MRDSTWRLLITPNQSGTENMALDESLLESVAREPSRMILRLYGWTPFCLSLGYAQPVSDADREALEAQGWDLVRRPTGGRAILHGDEITYAVIGPERNPYMRGGVLESYQHLSEGLVQALLHLGLKPTVEPDSARLNEEQRANPVCFEVPSAYEITAGGKKLIGSAQTRRYGAVLQHGTIPLTGDITRVCEVLSFSSEYERQQAKTKLSNRATTLRHVLGRAVRWEEAAEALSIGFQKALDLRFVEDLPTAEEIHRCAELVKDRYGHSQWTDRL
jgi:lipoate-protein ligase A